MQIVGDYQANGYAHLKGLIPQEVAQAFLHRLKTDMERVKLPLEHFASNSIIFNKPAIDISGHQYRPMIPFLWGLTPTMEAVTGKELLPTYNYFRIYREGDVCKIHSDRDACEHSLSLTLAYSDDAIWPFEVEHEYIEQSRPIRDAFDGEPHSTIGMQPGDAVLYKGINHRHGRVTPNPNRWSAHMFLHWVDKNGPYKACAFDGQDAVPGKVEFAL